MRKIHNKSTAEGESLSYSTEEHFLLKAGSIRDSLPTCCFQGHPLILRWSIGGTLQ